MTTPIQLKAACVLAASLLVPGLALAAEKLRVSCSVSVDYVFNGTLAESYRKDFVVEAGVGFNDDFSTQVRSKTFTASVAREASNAVVSIDYFNDVGVFNSVAFNAKLALHGGGVETTSGNYTFFTSLGVAGRHASNYTLSCRRI